MSAPDKPLPAPRFERSEFYEKLSREREENRARFEQSYSTPTQRALDAYETAKRKAEG